MKNLLYEAGCEDGALYFRNKIGFIEFEREGESIEKAIVSAIKNVESINRNVESRSQEVSIVRIEPGDLVTGAEISRRLNRSRESIRLLIKGARGSGDFPVPLAGVTAKTLIWSWAEVSRWFYNRKKISNPFVVEKAEFICAMNYVLKFREDNTLKENVAKWQSGISMIHSVKK